MKSWRLFPIRNKDIWTYDLNVDKFSDERIPGRWKSISIVNNVIFPTVYTLPVGMLHRGKPVAYIVKYTSR